MERKVKGMKNSGNLSLSASFSWTTLSQALQYLVTFSFLLILRSSLFNCICSNPHIQEAKLISESQAIIEARG